MANYTSSPLQYSAPLKSYDFDILGKALQYKQGQIDTNVAQVQSLIDNYATNVDLARDVDKAYFGNKLNGLVNQLNSLEGADYSSSNTTSILKGHISKAVDENVLTAVASTKNLRKLQADIDYVKTKEIDKYNPLNEAFAMRGAQEWLNNTEVGASYQGGTYNPYEDTNKTMLALAKDLKEVKGEQIVDVKLRDANGNFTGEIKRSKINGLTADELQSYLPNILPPTTLQQLKINGWGKYQGQGGLLAAQSNFTEYTQQVSTQLDRDIETAKIGENTSGISKTQKQYFANQRQALQQKKENFTSTLSNINVNDTASIGGFLETNQWLNNFSEIAAARESTEYDKDDTYFAQRDLELDYRRENRLESESQLGMLKTGLEIKKLEGEVGALGAPDVTLSPAVADIEQEIDPIKQSTDTYLRLAGEVNGITQKVYSEATADQKKLFDAEKQKSISAGQVESIANKQAFEKVFRLTNPEEYGRLFDVHTEKNNIATGIKLAKEDAIVENVTSKSDAVYNDLLTVAKSDPEAAQFIKDNKITPDTFKSAQNREIITKAADLLDGYDVDKTVTVGRGIPMLNPTYALNLVRGLNVNSPKKGTERRAQEILKEKGYVGKTNMYTANLNTQKDRTLVKNSIPQTADGFQFDDKEAMTVSVNSDGSLTVSQIKEGTKEGMITRSPRTAVIAKGSDLFGYFNNKLQLETNKTAQLSSDTPVKRAREIDFIPSESKDIITQNADYIITKTGGKSMSYSKTSPVNYLTASGTKQVYKNLSKNIPQEKLDLLVNLMDANSNKKFEVKAEVEKGNWVVTTSLKGATNKTINRSRQGNAAQNTDINLFVEQYPQITVGESMYNYLTDNPEQIDNILKALQ